MRTVYYWSKMINWFIEKLQKIYLKTPLNKMIVRNLKSSLTNHWLFDLNVENEKQTRKTAIVLNYSCSQSTSYW